MNKNIRYFISIFESNDLFVAAKTCNISIDELKISLSELEEYIKVKLVNINSDFEVQATCSGLKFYTFLCSL